VVSAAAFREGGSGWRLLDGEIFFSADGDNGGSLGFHDPRNAVHVEEWARRSGDPTEQGLADLDPAYVAALARGEHEARAALAAVRWHNATSSVPDPAQRIVLRVRGFERELGAGASVPWYRIVHEYLGLDLAFDDIGQQLVRAGIGVRFGAEMQPGARQLRDAAAEIYSTADHGGWQINVPAVIKHAPDLAPLFPAGSGGRRMLREVARNSVTGAHMRRWVNDAEQRSSRLLARSARQRNSVVHGRETVAAVVASVDRFLERVSGILVATGLHTSGASVIEHLTKGKKSNRERLDCLAHAPSGIDLFRDPDV
jgi:hypothetical protein